VIRVQSSANSYDSLEVTRIDLRHLSKCYSFRTVRNGYAKQVVLSYADVEHLRDSLTRMLEGRDGEDPGV
jgi:hypothetical protein